MVHCFGQIAILIIMIGRGMAFYIRFGRKISDFIVAIAFTAAIWVACFDQLIVAVIGEGRDLSKTIGFCQAVTCSIIGIAFV